MEGDLAQWPIAVQMALERATVDASINGEIADTSRRQADEVTQGRPLARRSVQSLDDATQPEVQGLELIEGDVGVTGSDPGALFDAGKVEPPTVHVHEAGEFAPPFLIGEREDIRAGANPAGGLCGRVFGRYVANDRSPFIELL